MAFAEGFILFFLLAGVAVAFAIPLAIIFGSVVFAFIGYPLAILGAPFGVLLLASLCAVLA